jgi:hypothetical protein
MILERPKYPYGAVPLTIFYSIELPYNSCIFTAKFFDLNVHHLTALNDNNHGIITENTSTTTNYGNSDFDFVRAVGSKNFPYAGYILRVPIVGVKNSLT